MRTILFGILIRTTHSYHLPAIKDVFKPVDRKILKLAKPAALNYVMLPIVSMADTFWVSKLGSPRELAAQGSADQIFSVLYVSLSFFPILLAPKITEKLSLKKTNDAKQLITLSSIITVLLGSFVAMLLFIFSQEIIVFVFGNNESVLEFSSTFLKYRGIGMPFALLNSVLFSAFRGIMNFSLAIRISVLTQLVNIILDPLAMKYLGLGGVACATVFSEILCSLGYIRTLTTHDWFTNKFTNIRPKLLSLLKQGILISMKNVLVYITYTIINRKILTLDRDGILLSANIILINLIEICTILQSALSSVATVMIASETKNMKQTEHRLLLWVVITGIIQFLMVLNANSFIRHFTDNDNVVDICNKMFPMVASYQLLNGIYRVYDGCMQGYQKFSFSSYANILGLLPMVFALHVSELSQIWILSIASLLFRIIIFKYKSNRIHLAS